MAVVATRRPAPARPAAARPAPVDTNNYLNFGDLAIYVAGGGVPEGNYALSFELQNYQATKADGSTSGAPRFGVMITAHSLDDPNSEPKTKFVSMGSKAIDILTTFDGKKVVVKPDGPGANTLPQSTNWGYFLKSLYDCGLPNGIFVDDISVLDGVHVHLSNIPEPEERKGFAKSATAEIQGEPRQNQTIPVVSEILVGGSPWEGGGGIPVKGEAKPAAGKPAVNKVLANKALPRPAAAAPVAEAPAMSDDDLADAATRGITTVLEKYPEGCSFLILRTATFKAVSESDGADVASAVTTSYFAGDDELNIILEPLGYVSENKKVSLVTA